MTLRCALKCTSHQAAVFLCRYCRMVPSFFQLPYFLPATTIPILIHTLHSKNVCSCSHCLRFHSTGLPYVQKCTKEAPTYFWAWSITRDACHNAFLPTAFGIPLNINGTVSMTRVCSLIPKRVPKHAFPLHFRKHKVVMES